jgi:Fe-S-cluster containining protein
MWAVVCLVPVTAALIAVSQLRCLSPRKILTDYANLAMILQSIEADGEIHLRNVSGKCFFLVENRCIVYQDRPEGCRLYPLVYDVDESKFVIDDYCPHHLNFIALRENKDNLKTLLRRVDKEREKRLRVRR